MHDERTVSEVRLEYHEAWPFRPRKKVREGGNAVSTQGRNVSRSCCREESKEDSVGKLYRDRDVQSEGRFRYPVGLKAKEEYFEVAGDGGFLGFVERGGGNFLDRPFTFGCSKVRMSSSLLILTLCVSSTSGAALPAAVPTVRASLPYWRSLLPAKCILTTGSTLARHDQIRPPADVEFVQRCLYILGLIGHVVYDATCRFNRHTSRWVVRIAALSLRRTLLASFRFFFAVYR
jgi:hypothetical protein